MPMTYDKLKALTVAELRDIAKDHEDAIQGFSQMNKEHLLPALCKALGVPMHEHHDVVGIDKSAIKVRMRELKKERDAALEAHDSDRLSTIRHQLHRLNHQLRAHTA
jgi:hypothetical protein